MERWVQIHKRPGRDGKSCDQEHRWTKIYIFDSEILFSGILKNKSQQQGQIYSYKDIHF